MLKIGHRGASGYEPENTLNSFKKAMNLKVDMVELDVHLCKTGELIVIHDETLERTTNGKGKISDKTLVELKELKTEKNQKIPTLEEVFDLVGRKAKVNIELKGKNTAKPVSKIIKKYVKTGWNYKDFLITSFSRKEIENFYRLNKKSMIGILVKKVSKNIWKLAKKFKAYSINIPLSRTTKKIVDEAHKHKLNVLVWTANTARDIQRAEMLCADGIFSNFPDKINQQKI